jgi:hypothetical protein
MYSRIGFRLYSKAKINQSIDYTDFHRKNIATNTRAY